MNKLLNNALMSTSSIESVLVDQNKIKKLVDQSHTFTHGLKWLPNISDQKRSGRCWMFANLYYYRSAMIKAYSLDPKFDFSTSWLYFYDKLEKFRHCLLLLKEDPALRKTNADLSCEYDRYIYLGDGGHMDCLLNLIEKYGLVPKDAYGESTNTEKTAELNKLFRRLFRIYAYRMKLATDDELEALVDKGVQECQQLLEYCLGKPPTSFTWKYRGVDDYATSREVKHSHAPFKRCYFVVDTYTPKQFWEKVKASAAHQLSRIISTNDPFRSVPTHVAGIQKVTNVHEKMGARSYLTMSMDDMLEYAKKLIRAGLPVIFSCGVHHDCHYSEKYGVMDHNLFNYDELCPSLVDFDDLKDRIKSGSELPNHIMCIVGYNIIDNTWKIANSWGTQHGYSGFWIATTDWFRARLCEFNIPISLLNEEHKAVANAKPTEQYGLDSPLDCMIE